MSAENCERINLNALKSVACWGIIHYRSLDISGPYPNLSSLAWGKSAKSKVCRNVKVPEFMMQFKCHIFHRVPACQLA